MTKYSLETKLTAVNAYLDGVESFKDTAQKYNVNMTMLKKWVAKFRVHGLAAFQKTYTNYSMGWMARVAVIVSGVGGADIGRGLR